MHVLITNLCLDGRTGTETLVRDISFELLRIGHNPIVYTQSMGPIAAEIRARGISVTDDINTISSSIDVIHGHHTHTTAIAVTRFPDVPAIFICHDFAAWHDSPPKLPSIRRFVAIGFSAAERLQNIDGISPDKITIIQNGVDYARFSPGPSLPEKPQKALAFCRSAKLAIAIEDACRKRDISVDLVGVGVGRVIDNPEDKMRECDIVFASGRTAREALSCQRAVICCDDRGLSGMIGNSEFGGSKHDFGLRGLNKKLTVEGFVEEIDRYNAADALMVSNQFRLTGGIDQCVARYLQVYKNATDDQMAAGKASAMLPRALANHLQLFSPGKTGFWPWYRERDILLKELSSANRRLKDVPSGRWLGFGFKGAARHFARLAGFFEPEDDHVWGGPGPLQIRIAVPKGIERFNIRLEAGMFLNGSVRNNKIIVRCTGAPTLEMIAALQPEAADEGVEAINIAIEAKAPYRADELIDIEMYPAVATSPKFEHRKLSVILYGLTVVY